MTHLNALCMAEGIELPKTRALSAILLEMGYEQIAGKRIKIGKTGSMHYVWRKADGVTDDVAKAEVRGFHDDPDYVLF